MHALTRLYLGAVLLLSPAVVNAIPIAVTGFGDSLTCDSCNDGSYLRLLDGIVPQSLTFEDEGQGANQTGTMLARLVTWIATAPTVDYLVIMGGTVDAFQTSYAEATTLTNIQAMVDAVLLAGIPLVLLAPPPVVDPCVGSTNPDCASINARLASLADEIEAIASTGAIPFIHLYDAFLDDPDTDGLFRSGGLHPLLATGDQLIADLVALQVPEPSTLLLMGMGLFALLAFNRHVGVSN